MALRALMHAIHHFLTHLKPRRDALPLLEQIRLMAFYCAVVVAVLGAVFSLQNDLADGRPLPALVSVFFLALVALALVLLWTTRRLSAAQAPSLAATAVLLASVIIEGGGRYGFDLLYLMAGFSLVYLLFSLRVSLILSAVFLVGIGARLLLGAFEAPSIFAIPELVPRAFIYVILTILTGTSIALALELFVRNVRRLVIVDPVTALPNRTKLEEFLHEATTQEHGNRRGFAVIGIKALNLNRINSHLGTARGDLVLQEFAQRLAKVLKPCRITGRWNGPIFLCIMDIHDHDRLVALGRRLLAELAHPFLAHAESVRVQSAVAVCRYPEDSDSASQTLANLLSLMDRSRIKPEDILFFNEDNRRAELFRFQLGEAFREEHLDKQFHLVYQPKIRLSDSRTTGVEALLRWQHPILGSVAPTDFIPLTEESGDIRKITRWIIRRVIQDSRSIREYLGDQGFVIAINLSVADLSDRDFISFLHQQFDEGERSGIAFEFELTEGMLVDGDPIIQESLQTLHQMGFRIAIDDFGTGYSSLSYLHRMQVHTLKLDRSFVQQISSATPLRGLPVIDAILSMGTALGLEITAEGVETRSQAAYLRTMGCTTAQGWLYSSALALPQLLEWLKVHGNPAPDHYRAGSSFF